MKKKIVRQMAMIREFSVPLIAGVVTALAWANLSPSGYHRLVEGAFIGDLSLHFISNDIFMVFFFAMAAAEITKSCLPGGDLNPLHKAVNPLLATLGGVTGPIVVFLVLNRLIGSPTLAHGWGVPTATDIAFAWLGARAVFGGAHPVISYLLLLAVADDAIGLVIIAIFYPDPAHPVQPAWLLVTACGVGGAYLLRRGKIRNYWPYLAVGGGASWLGLFYAHLHPALALVFIVPFLPTKSRERGHLFEEDQGDRSTLARFEHEWKVLVDFGMFIFGLANAGVAFSGRGTATWLVLLALLIGKSVGVFTFASIGRRLGYGLPEGMRNRELLVAGVVAGIGFTVALFVAGEAFTDPSVQGAAKIGALFSLCAVLIALALGRMLRITRLS